MGPGAVGGRTPAQPAGGRPRRRRARSARAGWTPCAPVRWRSSGRAPAGATARPRARRQPRSATGCGRVLVPAVRPRPAQPPIHAERLHNGRRGGRDAARAGRQCRIRKQLADLWFGPRRRDRIGWRLVCGGVGGGMSAVRLVGPVAGLLPAVRAARMSRPKLCGRCDPMRRRSIVMSDPDGV